MPHARKTLLLQVQFYLAETRQFACRKVREQRVKNRRWAGMAFLGRLPALSKVQVVQDLVVQVRHAPEDAAVV